MVLRLARYFGTDAQSRLNLQAAYDLRVADSASAHAIDRQVQPGEAVRFMGRTDLTTS